MSQKRSLLRQSIFQQTPSISRRRSRYSSRRQHEITLNPLTTPTRVDLIAALNWRYDPFEYRVAEQESDINFGEVYLPEETLLNKLLQTESTLVFATYGMGKSATRLALEYELRLSPTPEPTLAVRYKPHFIPTMTQELHREQIVATLAVDLVIQAFERLNSASNPLDDNKIAALQRQATLLPSQLRRTRLMPLKDAPPPDGAFWGTLRPVVETLNVGQRWRELMDLVIGATGTRALQPMTWEQAIQDVRMLGFKDIFLLIDAVDEHTIDPELWLGFLAPLFAMLPELQHQHIYIKCFLPSAVEAKLRERYAAYFAGLTPMPSLTTMGKIPEDRLSDILTYRVQAAKHQSSDTQNLDLLGAAINVHIQAWLAAHAQGSPRRLLHLASRLLDFHTEQGFKHKRLYLTRDEWAAFQQTVEHRALDSTLA